ncbi:MAG: hypothetical protein ACLP2J_02945, partial [Acidimicrobiales bacterium]
MVTGVDRDPARRSRCSGPHPDRWYHGGSGARKVARQPLTSGLVTRSTQAPDRNLAMELVRVTEAAALAA